MTADAKRSDLSGALRDLRDRYRERRVAAIVVISDGGETGAQDLATSVEAGSVPVYTIGVGSSRVTSDLEVLDVAAGEMALADSSVDISVAAVRRGSTDPFDLRVLENGRPIDIRRVVPAADGGPVRAVFTVSPSRNAPTLYTVEIPSAAGERVLENNRRTLLVEPPGRRRRILMIEGAPGFEHSFIKRVLAADPGLELDSVVRKGSDARGAATYFIQATAARAPRLATGFPQEREALYEYDAVVLANVDPDVLSRSQLKLLADFVDARGGGLLVLGARSLVQQSFANTALEDVLPLRLTDRGNGVVRITARPDVRFAVTLTPDGQSHPIMRIGEPGDMATRWAALPPLSGAAALGALRPGAQALALVQTPDGPRPLVAVQRYGQGCSMLFTGEASWRWRMQMPSGDRTYELFWRQAARWTAAGAPDLVSVESPPAIVPGSTAAIAVDVRSEAFAPVSDAQVTLQVTPPGGASQDVRATLPEPQSGRYSAEVRFDEPGIYHVTAAAQSGAAVSGRGERWLLVGGVDLEMADPRLNEEVLRRIATATGGSYLPAQQAAQLSALLASGGPGPSAPRWQELWHNVWIFAGVLMLLAIEWTLRRRWGLR
ncbi:MAG: FixH family protein [Acidobacteria bacterium]|nr:FixH family protein [Acidobacteriota bacterium]